MHNRIDPVVHGVVVTYEPDSDRLLLVLKALAPQVRYLLIVDNSETPESQKEVREIALEVSKKLGARATIHLHAGTNREVNVGLSRAYNIAIADAQAAGADYLLLLDQDSIVADDMVEALLRGFKRGEQQSSELGLSGAPAMVGPWYTDTLSGRRSVVIRTQRFSVNYVRLPEDLSSNPDERQRVIPTEMLISSGSLVAMSAFDAVGELDPELFIDHVDTEWCLRLIHSGRWMAVVPEANMSHQLGDRVLRLWWGRWRLLPVHSPIRLYYTFRNSLWLYARPHGHWRWILFDVKRLCAVTLIHMLASGPRWPRIRMIVKGLRDGLLNKPSAPSS